MSLYELNRIYHENELTPSIRGPLVRSPSGASGAHFRPVGLHGALWGSLGPSMTPEGGQGGGSGLVQGTLVNALKLQHMYVLNLD